MSREAPADRALTPEAHGRESLARRRPVLTFLVLAFGIGWPALAIPVIAEVSSEPFLLVFLFAALLAPALLVTRWADGPGAVRRMLSRSLLWRFGWGRWAVILLGMPLLTIGVAAVSGTLRAPDRGWAAEAGWYLFNTLIFGALIANVWEETAWGGFAQSRLMARHGLLVGSLLTAPLFAMIHVPMQFADGASLSKALTGVAILLAVAPFYRYLLGMHLLDTGGSILAIGVQHAAWNAAGNIEAFDGEWQVIVAAILLTVLVAAATRHRPWQLDRVAAERDAAASWLAPSHAAVPVARPT